MSRALRLRGEHYEIHFHRGDAEAAETRREEPRLGHYRLLHPALPRFVGILHWAQLALLNAFITFVC